MVTYRTSKIVVTEGGSPISAFALGTTFPVELLDDKNRTLLILHYEDEESAEAGAEALAFVSKGLLGVTDPSV